MKNLIESNTEKWKLNELFQVVNDFHGDIEKVTKEKRIKDTDAFEMMLCRIVGKSILSLHEVIALCQVGYADGAMSIARNIFEQQIFSSFIYQKFAKKETEELNAIISDYELDRELQWLKYMETRADYFDNEALKEIECKKTELKGKKNSKRRGQYWWAGCNTFRDLVKTVIDHYEDEESKNIIRGYYLGYMKSCLSIHASNLGNELRLGKEHLTHVIDTCPTSNGQATPLYYSVGSLIIIIGVVCDIFGMNFAKYKGRINDLFDMYTEKYIEGNYDSDNENE